MTFKVYFRSFKMPITEQHQNSSVDDVPKDELLKYGELVILGYNGSLPQAEWGTGSNSIKESAG